MADPLTIAMLGLGAGGALLGARNRYATAKNQAKIDAFQQKVRKTSASLLEHDKDIARRRAADTRSRIDRDLKFMLGSTRASFAGRGISVESGSVEAITNYAERVNEKDHQTIDENLANELYGVSVQQYSIRAGVAIDSAASKANVNAARASFGTDLLGIASGTYFKYQGAQ